MPKIPTSTSEWYTLKNPEDITSPALLVYPNRIEENIIKMISIAEGTTTLRPHIKTHKTAEIVKMQQRHGIQKFKCATIAEAELLGQCEAEDVLLAMQPVGLNIERFFKLTKAYPNTQFSTLVDNTLTLSQICEFAIQEKTIVRLYLDINNGMNRTGCILNDQAINLYRTLDKHPHVSAMGFHAYDGHIHDSDLDKRREVCAKDFQPVLSFEAQLDSLGIDVPNIIAGGSPTFSLHNEYEGVETSPGTTLLWDAQYAEHFPDMDYLNAAVLLIRIISKPTKDILCFDLGHKSVACEMNLPRVTILGLEDSTQISQSEEHLVVETQRAHEFEVGDCCYAIPMHICPTVAKYDELLVVQNGEIKEAWKVSARNQRITI